MNGVMAGKWMSRGTGRNKDERQRGEEGKGRKESTSKRKSKPRKEVEATTRQGYTIINSADQARAAWKEESEGTRSSALQKGPKRD